MGINKLSAQVQRPTSPGRSMLKRGLVRGGGAGYGWCREGCTCGGQKSAFDIIPHVLSTLLIEMESSIWPGTCRLS